MLALLSVYSAIQSVFPPNFLTENMTSKPPQKFPSFKLSSHFLFSTFLGLEHQLSLRCMGIGKCGSRERGKACEQDLGNMAGGGGRSREFPVEFLH